MGTYLPLRHIGLRVAGFRHVRELGMCSCMGSPMVVKGFGMQKAQSWHNALKELLLVLLLCIVWGKERSGKLIRGHCDNMAVAEVVNSGYSRDREMMHLLRCLFFIAEHFRMQVEAVHLPREES